MHKFLIVLLISLFVMLCVGQVFAETIKKTPFANGALAQKLAQLHLPPNFNIQAFAGHLPAQNLQGARLMAIGPDGHLYVTLPQQNKVVMLPDENHDGVADKVVLVAAEGLKAPHGLAFVKDTLFIANQDSVVRVEENNQSQKNHTQKNKQWPAIGVTPIIQHLATGGHTLKSLKLGPDGYFYLNVGSSCNVCIEEDTTRASILRYTTAGQPAGHLATVGQHAPSPVWAQGLRNSQGFAWQPETQAMFATNEGADNRSDKKNGAVNDDMPPEHLNKIVAGKHYGWPHCWGKLENGQQFTDPNFAGEEHFCQKTQAPEITLPAHATPIGITFLAQAKLPTEYQKDALVALHGSWNRAALSGYKVVRVKFNAANEPVDVVDFLTGWLNKNQAWGRPVDVIVGQDHAIYISDDQMGLIYRVHYQASKK